LPGAGGEEMVPPHDDERPSWREIDRLRDRSPHTRRRERSESHLEKALRSKWLKERYLKEVEKFFSGKKGSEEHEKALKAIHRAYGTNRFNRAVKKYIEEYGLPEDWGTLILLLDHKDPGIVCQALEALKNLYPQKGLVEQQGFVSKTRVLAMTARQEEVREAAQSILEEIQA